MVLFGCRGKQRNERESIMATTTNIWITFAKCTPQDADIMSGSDTYEQAMELCDRCTVVKECLDTAKKFEATDGYRSGIWGGTTPGERTRLWGKVTPNHTPAHLQPVE
jgi:hypothetical protein